MKKTVASWCFVSVSGWKSLQRDRIISQKNKAAHEVEKSKDKLEPTKTNWSPWRQTRAYVCLSPPPISLMRMIWRSCQPSPQSGIHGPSLLPALTRHGLTKHCACHKNLWLPASLSVSLAGLWALVVGATSVLLLDPLFPAQYLTQSNCSITIFWMNE